jgi:hypothetical protein
MWIQVREHMPFRRRRTEDPPATSDEHARPAADDTEAAWGTILYAIDSTPRTARLVAVLLARSFGTIGTALLLVALARGWLG